MGNHHLVFLTAFVILLLMGVASPVLAQEPTDTTRIWLIETRDGNQFVGAIVERTPEVIRLKTESLGIINILMNQVKEIREVLPERVRQGVVWMENPQDTRYLWAPNGYGLRKGEAYYQNIWIFYNQVSVGLANNFSIGAGTVPLFLFGGAPTPVWITPKVSFPIVKESLNVGAGLLLGTVIGASDATFGIAYGVSTFGKRDENISIGLGYGFLAGEWANTPLIEVGGMARISRRTYLMSENYYIQAGGDSFLLLSAGGRTVWNTIALDYALLIPAVSEGSFIAIPFLGITIPMGKKELRGL